MTTAAKLRQAGHRSQLRELDGAAPIVPPPVLAHFLRPLEAGFETGPR